MPDARERLVEELRAHALSIGEVTLTSGATAQYYVDVKRAILRPAGFAALAEMVAHYAREWEATAVGGLTMGADAPACAALAGGADVKAFFVRKETKRARPAAQDRGAAAGERRALPDRRGRGHHGRLDRAGDRGGAGRGLRRLRRDHGAGPAGGWAAQAIALASGDAPYQPLTTIDDVYPDRPEPDQGLSLQVRTRSGADPGVIRTESRPAAT